MNLTVRNFRNIKECKFNIIDNTLILVGKNGVGKSNVLEAIKRKNYTISNSNSYDDIVYIDAELSINDDINLATDQIFTQLVNILYDGLDEDIKFQKLLDEVNNVLKENDYLNKRQMNDIEDENIKQKFFRSCSELASGFKRRLLYKLLYNIAIEAVDKKLIIMVDSPELYAHPSMVRMFCNELKFLADKGHLVIVTTHNASVVETLSTDIRQIAKLTLEEQMLQTYQVDIEEYTSKIRSFYNNKNIYYLPNGKVNIALVHIIQDNLESFCKSFLREGALKVLFADYIILGEGSSEEVLFNYIFTRSEYDVMMKYSKNNVDYISGFGKFYLPFYFILGNLYNVKIVCMFDIDNLDNRSHKAFYKAFSNYEIENKDKFVTIMLDPDLEHELDIKQSKHRVEKPLHIFNEVYYRHNNIDKIVEMIENALNILQ